MDEQRILEEMERMLAADDPKLAARLAAFGQPGFGQVLRTRRARATLSVMVLVLIAAVAAVIYMMSSLRPGNAPTGHGQPSAQHSTSPRGTVAPSAQVSSPGQYIQRGSTGQCAATVPSGCPGWTVSPGQVMPRPSHQAAP